MGRLIKHKSCYPRGASLRLKDVKKIIDKEPNIPKLVEEYEKLFWWKCPICKKTFSTKQCVSRHINNFHIKKNQNGELILFLNCCARQHLKNLQIHISTMKKETLDLYYCEKDRNRKREIEKEFELCLLYYNLYNLYYYEKIRKKK